MSAIYKKGQSRVELCTGYWSETSGLLDQATAMQQKRLKQLHGWSA